MKLSNAISKFNLAYQHWGKQLLTNPRYCRKGFEIAWAGTRSMWPKVITYDTLATIEERREYSFQTRDGSILQLWYRFAKDNNSLTDASLGFIFAISCTDDSNPVYPWVRIDYDPEAVQGPTHALCHMHSSLAGGMRVPVSRIPLPTQFIDMIAAWFYPEQYNAVRVHPETYEWMQPGVIDAINRPPINTAESDINDVVHVAVP